MREALILRAGPERGLAEPRVADQRHSLGVDDPLGLQVVERAAQPPRPRADRAPLALGRTRLARLVEQRVHAVLEPVVEVGIEIAVVGRGERVAVRDEEVDREARGLGAARRVRGAVIDDARVAIGEPGVASLMAASLATAWLPWKFSARKAGTGSVAFAGR